MCSVLQRNMGDDRIHRPEEQHCESEIKKHLCYCYLLDAKINIYRLYFIRSVEYILTV